MAIIGSREVPRVGLTPKSVQQSVIPSTFTLQTAVGLLIGIASFAIDNDVEVHKPRIAYLLVRLLTSKP
jgi:hypothetical protein